MSLFVGRETELALLRWNPETKKSRLSAVYGRRRIGKTRLILQVAKSSDLPFLVFEGLENQATEKQKSQFLRTLKKHFQLDSCEQTERSSWLELFELLSDLLEEKPHLVLFDEFQWLAEEKSELVSDLKYVWDNLFSRKNNVHMIICGSVSSFIVKKVIESSALYGRIDTPLELQDLPLRTVGEAFMPGRSLYEQATYYFAVGGVPKYFELYDNTQSAMLNLQNLCFSSSGYFYQELRRLFISHFGRVASYAQIVKLLALSSPLSREEIAKKMSMASGGRLTEYLTDLELAGFIEKYVPMQDSYERYARYRLRDYFLRFYFRFIDPVHARLQAKPLDLVQALPQQKFAIWQGLAYEFFCVHQAESLAHQLGFSAVRYDYGSWYSKKSQHPGVQVDLLYKRADKVLTLCEIKFGTVQRSKILTEMTQKVESLRSHLKPALQNWTIEPILITFNPQQEKFAGDVTFRKIISLEDIVC